jgi:pimeloyl-ACP methyl ester carboxylesterase
MEKTELDLKSFCAPGATVREEWVKIDENVRLRVFVFHPARSTGQPAVVFVAGWMSLIDGWEKVLREMTRDFVVYYLETREKKSSIVKGHAGYSISDIGMDVVKLVDYYGLKKGQYVILGSSLGATAIVECSRFFNVSPRALVLISPNAVFRVPRFAKILIRIFYPPMFVLFRPFVKWYLKTFRLDMAADEAQYLKYCRTLDNADPRKSKKTVMALWNYRIWDKLEQVEFPALIVGASKDRLHEPENTRRMVNLMPGSTYLDLETNARNHSKEVVEQIRSYLSAQAGET